MNAKVCYFRTQNRGWGLKANEDIHAGKFIIEYVGMYKFD
jgi:SET domain-containing protein